VDEGRVERGGIRLHYLERQPAEPTREPALFLLHGLSSNARIWDRVTALLPNRRVVALDQRSHGLSDRPATGYASAELVADAVHVIDTLELDRPLVAGHSWGAAIALALAANHPDRAAGLVFVDGPTVSFGKFMTWEEAAKRMQPPLPNYRDLDEAAAAMLTSLGDAWGDDLREFVRAGLVEQQGGWASTLTAPVRLQILQDLYSFEPEPLFGRVDGPVQLAMAGQLWPGAPEAFVEMRRRSAEEVRQRREDVGVRWYESRHDIPLIRPTELAADVERTAIAAGFWSLSREAAGLLGAPAEAWRRPAHGDVEGWDAKDLLAHLSSTQAALAGVVSTEPAATGADDGRPAFDADRWNASQVRRRRERPPSELVDELRGGAQELHAALTAIDPARSVAVGPFAGRTVGEAMASMLQHQRAHFAELRSVISSGATP
jgi:pimeloyl-ACP methyl ester carboxylesterase